MRIGVSRCANIATFPNYWIIPFLDSVYKSEGHSVAKLIHEALGKGLDTRYSDLCSKIDVKFRDSMINVATMTITKDLMIPKKTRRPSSKTSKLHSSRKSKINLNTMEHLVQIYLVRINDAGMEENELLEELRVTGHMIYNVLRDNFIRNVILAPLLDMKSKSKSKSNLAASIGMQKALLEGMMLSSYKFDKYKTKKSIEHKNGKSEYFLNRVIVKVASMESWKQLVTEIQRLNSIVKSVFLARDIVNEPANDNRAGRFIDSIKEFIKNNRITGLEIEVWDVDKLEKMGMGLILGVGKGSTPENAPRVLVIKYKGVGVMQRGGKSDDESHGKCPEWVLLGKGITFDTGGLDLKTEKGMRDMKSDLSGAAAVVAFLLGYAMCGGGKCITVMCPFAENSIGSGSIKPSDVLRAYDGRTVEVTDTDAEGRLVLADILAYVVKEYPAARMLDMATLTGQAEAISGKAFSCVLSINAEKETTDLIETSMNINEALVRLPLLEKEVTRLESSVADIKNVSYKSSADIIMSSVFMREFVRRNTKWIHIDIAGPAFEADEVVKYASPEASGVGVRLLMEYFKE